MTVTSIAERIIAARTAAGFGEGQGPAFARELKIPAVSLWRYEKGKNVPGPEVLAQIAEHCGCSIDWLVTGKGKGPHTPQPNSAVGSGTGQ